ncbi:hypothetical protein PLANTIT3_60503 [Plantibacter sp. T3]|nr:hypothetical protein PLANTIT3_60503 [Plantibacter sp. T3]
MVGVADDTGVDVVVGFGSAGVHALSPRINTAAIAAPPIRLIARS